DNARLSPGQKIIAINGIIFSADALKKAINQAKGNTNPIKLIVQSDSFVNITSIDYHDGERYPALERIPGTPDYLDDITTPLTKHPSAPQPR
ncbi:MAG TPA: M61 family peptidase, partial [Edaphobacter sp.]|nr:M61 family peptidase [Edaphobacter sp.]